MRNRVPTRPTASIASGILSKFEASALPTTLVNLAKSVGISQYFAGRCPCRLTMLFSGRKHPSLYTNDSWKFTATECYNAMLTIVSLQ